MTIPTRFRALLTVVVLGAAQLSASPSHALIEVGAGRPPTRVLDANDRPFDVESVKGRPMLVVYEDKDHANLNVGLKDELSRLARGERYRRAVALVPVADVRTYDYWPVRGFVKDAIRDESKKLGATIYCDWDGAFGRAFALQHGTSSVVLVGKNARVLFAQDGKISAADTRRLLELLRAEVEGNPGT